MTAVRRRSCDSAWFDEECGHANERKQTAYYQWFGCCSDVDWDQLQRARRLANTCYSAADVWSNGRMMFSDLLWSLIGMVEGGNRNALSVFLEPFFPYLAKERPVS